MSETVMGLIIGLLTLVIGFFLGKRVENNHTAVKDSDLLEGIAKRKVDRERYEKSIFQIEHEAKKASEAVTKKLKEAPNEEIVDMFYDAFGHDPPSDGTD